MKVLLMYQPGQAHFARLRAAAPKAEFLVAGSEAEAQTLIVEAEAVLGNRYFLQSLPFAKRLRWMQSNSMGTDLVLTGSDRLKPVTLTCARGLYDDEVADHAVALALALARGIHLVRDHQHRKAWQRWNLVSLAGRTAMILGWGGVGKAIARRLAGFGMNLMAVRRTPDGLPGKTPEGVLLFGPAGWQDKLPDIDLLLMALPLTPLTLHMIGAPELDRLPTTSYLVNVGRGQSLDENALLIALKANRLAGAALDVFETEPLPPEHPAWQEPKLIISPHLGRSQETPPFRWEPLFEENLKRFAEGQPLLNIVNQIEGY